MALGVTGIIDDIVRSADKNGRIEELQKEKTQENSEIISIK